MTPDERLRFIQAIERAGYHVEATEDRDGDVMILTVWGNLGHIARAISPNRYDFEELSRKFYAWQAQGSRFHRTRKAAA